MVVVSTCLLGHVKDSFATARRAKLVENLFFQNVRRTATAHAYVGLVYVFFLFQNKQDRGAE